MYEYACVCKYVCVKRVLQMCDTQKLKIARYITYTHDLWRTYKNCLNGLRGYSYGDKYVFDATLLNVQVLMLNEGDDLVIGGS